MTLKNMLGITLLGTFLFASGTALGQESAAEEATAEAAPADIATAPDTTDDYVAVWSVIEEQWEASQRGDRRWVEKLLSVDFSGWPKDAPAPRDKASTRLWTDFETKQGKVSNVLAAELAEKSPGVLYSTAGVHPHHASGYDDASDALIRTLIQKDVVVAVGECGLDYFRNLSPPEAQLEAFARQLEIAMDSGLPVFLHQRDAHDDFVELLEPALPNLSRAVAHCFTGEGESLREYVAMGLYIGITRPGRGTSRSSRCR